MSISTDDLGRITERTSVIDSDGDKLGTINQIYTSDATGDPAWVTLKTGLFGSQESFVPLTDATFDGDDIRVPVSKKQVHDAPRVDADGHLSVEEEDDLYRYYGLHNPGQPDGGADTDRTDDRVDTDRRTDDRVDDDRRTDDGPVEAAGAGAAAAAVTSPDRDDELAQRDVEGRDEVADDPEPAPRHAQEDDTAPAGGGDDDAVKPGERTTRLRRYVVTERVVQTIEELPDEPSR